MSRPGDDGRCIVISQGEPSGVGPEIAVKAWEQFGGRIKNRPLRLVGSLKLFLDTAARLRVDAGALKPAIIETGEAINAEPGRPSPQNAQAVIDAIAHCARLCLEGKAAAMVTAPIQKSALTAAGFGFPGHTEYLEHLTKADRAVMMLASTGLEPALRVVPFTIHTPLRDIFAALNPEAIVRTAALVLRALKTDFGCEAPVLALAGLNPHAGEDGTIGREEIECLAPAASQLRSQGHRVLGPLSADTLFHDEARKTYDAVLCMYHDQALIPIKTLAFWTGVNVTLGLPIVRTSPDHGTALDLAGKGIANEKSMMAAIALAADIAEKRGL